MEFGFAVWVKGSRFRVFGFRHFGFTVEGHDPGSGTSGLVGIAIAAYLWLWRAFWVRAWGIGLGG